MIEALKNGGFIVEAEHMRLINGRRIISKEKGVVRLEETQSKKGNPIMRVAEVIGITDAIKVGDSSPSDLSSFPEWVRKGYRQSHLGGNLEDIRKIESEN